MTTSSNPTPAAQAPPSSVLSLSVPVAMGYVPLGMVFGFLFVQAGAPWWLALTASVMVYAGASQFMMVPMLAAGLPLATIALATLVVNLRHVFYGLSLLDKLPTKPWARWYLVFALTDETYSVLTTLPAGTSTRQMVTVALLNQGWWVLGTLLGAVIGAQTHIGLVGLDFALAALFAVLAVEQWRGAHSAAPLWVAVTSYAIALTLMPQQALLLAIGLSVLAGLFWPATKTQKTTP
ncbi:AzlC family ABC transporter permease [Rhodoferax sp.]|uniref:AzlC family ABC transporter permease n=1 Tax=Rhodoferax sp. TaxID=50421 RepID=UPI00272F67AC|nr:AzlC family ABC transporter permease [Rhodoferax sp.]MDP1531136.1 AzlC family ABC transporter permease [Rhodoferax sp.]MDP1942186.1 AzlC family ABC transporter permease [Rhodoferax sp.]MDP2442806.1 AzlC family ABC transporter permease [Rhodoferax sp.]MDZ4207872.1 AzlC family ABC transporter permease [Rhodoferax sp.]